jgi:hypothetical protein
LIEVKPWWAFVADTAELLRPASSCHAGNALAESSILRFAVGAFDSWQQLGDALGDLRLRGLVLDGCNCLAFERVFAGNTVLAPSETLLRIEPLAFPESGEPVACTAGPLADCLAERLRSGARSLKGALGHWLLARHAAHFQDVVEAGKILLWISLADAEDERRACQSLLANSSNSVGVHDLVAPPAATGGASQ